jgi:hypothetical protein
MCIDKWMGTACRLRCGLDDRFSGDHGKSVRWCRGLAGAEIAGLGCVGVFA